MKWKTKQQSKSMKPKPASLRKIYEMNKPLNRLTREKERINQ